MIRHWPVNGRQMYAPEPNVRMMHAVLTTGPGHFCPDRSQRSWRVRQNPWGPPLPIARNLRGRLSELHFEASL